MLVFCHYSLLSIQRYAISNERELHCVRADVFGDLKIYVSEALARFARSLAHVSYFFSSVGTFGGLAPQYPKAGYASVLTWIS